MRQLQRRQSEPHASVRDRHFRAGLAVRMHPASCRRSAQSGSDGVSAVRSRRCERRQIGGGAEAAGQCLSATECTKRRFCRHRKRHGAIEAQ